MVNHYAVPPGQSGGTRHWVLGRFLHMAGHDVSIIAANVNYQSRQGSAPSGELYRARLENVDGIRFLWLDVPEYANALQRVWSMIIFALRALVGRAPSYLPRPDVIIGSTPHPFAALAAYLLSRRHKARFVLEVRDIWPESLVDVGGYSWANPLIRAVDILEKFPLRRADRVISLLPNAAEDLVAKGAIPEKIVWIPNGIDATLFNNPGPAIDGPEFKVLYAGAHGLANGLDVMVDAAKLLQERQVSDIQFILVGDGARKPALAKRVEELGLTNISFRDSVPKAEMPAVLSEANACFLHLRDLPVFRWGVSPNKLFDYMAAARPVIFAVNTTNNPVEEAGAGRTIPPEDPQALADAVCSLSQLSSGERQRQGSQGRDYVMTRHTDGVLGAKLLKTLEQLVSRG